MKKYFSTTILISALSFILIFSQTHLVWGWTNPNGNPPAGSNNQLLYSAGGNIGIATTTTTYPLNVSGVIYTSGGIRFNDGTTQNTAFLGASTQTITSGNVSAGAFGSNTGGGNYSFPASVGIGISSPLAPLQVQHFKAGTNETAANNYITAYAGLAAGWDGSNWRIASDGTNNAGGLLSSTMAGDLRFYTFSSTGGTDQLITDANLNSYMRMIVNQYGNVGIGTTSPGATLDVSGTGIIARGTVSTASTGGLTLKTGLIASTPSNATDAFIGVENTGGPSGSAGDILIIPRSSTGVPSAIRMFTGQTTIAERMTINTNGDVGIGTISPTEQLDVRPIAYANNQSGGVQIGTTNGYWLSGFRIKSNATGNPRTAIDATSGGTTGATNEAISIDPSGRVGIATTTPAYPLTVNGTIASLSGGVRFPDGTTQTTAFSGGSTQTIVAGNVSSGAFGSNTGGGNYSFPANVGIGTTNPTASLEVYGASQLTAALTDAGVTTGILALNSSLTTSGSGGTLTFGNSQSVTAGSVGFAAIKGLLADGSTNTKGDLAFSTRNATTDTALTERMRILASGNVGIGTASPSATLDVNGYAKDKTGYLSRNLLDTTVWTISSGSIGSFIANQTSANENARVWGTDPFGRPTMLWEGVSDGGSDASGGWNYSNIPIDPNKAYRSLVWIMKPVTGSGNYYLGCSQSNTLNLNGTSNSNPYFVSGVSGVLTAGRWYLLVGYIHANNDPSTTSYSAIYDGVTGQKIISGTDFKNSTATTQMQRAYNYYDTTNGSIQYFWGSRFEEINGSEPSIEALLGDYQSATNATTAYFGGNVGIATTTPAYPLTVNGTIASLSGGVRFPDGTTQTTAFSGGSTQTIVAGNVSSGAFGSNTGGGNYSFPANVGIGTTNPTASLEVYGASQLTAALTDAGVTTGILALNSSLTTSGSGGTLTFGNSQSVTAGSVGFAAIKGLLADGSTNTKGDLAFSTRNATTDTALTERMRILASGNVGIGTTSPGYSLQVNGAALLGSYVGVANGDTVPTQIGGLTLGYSGTNNYSWIQSYNAKPLALNPVGNNVGIGTIAPLSRLQIGDTTVNTENQIHLGKYEASTESNLPIIQQKSILSAGVGNDLALGAQSTSGGILFYTGATTVEGVLGGGSNAIRMSITNTGNVGIGTTAPAQKLSVAGTIESTSGGFKFPDGTTQTTGYAGGTQTIVAGNVSAGAFGSNTGGGNYSFPAALALGGNGTGDLLTINTANTPSTNGGLLIQSNAAGSAYFRYDRQTGWAGKTYIGNNASTTSDSPSTAITIDGTSGTNLVGIGTTSPGSLLNLYASTPALQLSPSAYGGTSYSTYLGANSNSTGVLQFGNNGTNYIVAGNTAAGGALSFVVNNSNAFPATPNGTTAMTINSSGNVGIGTTSPDSKLSVNGAIETSSAGENHYYNVLSYYVGVGAQTGTLKITLPKYGSNTMLNIIIRGYDYSSTGSWETVIGGYNYGTHNWFNYSAQINGRAPFSSVRLGNDGINDVILLGTTATVWNYSTIEVSEVIATYSNTGGWDSGWAASLLTSETGLLNLIAAPINMFTNTSSNVGIGTVTPTTGRLVVSGGNIALDGSSYITNLATPISSNTNYAATVGYVNSAITGGAGIGSFSTLTVSATSTLSGNIIFGGLASSNLAMNGYNITGVNKLTVQTVDPLYNINGKNYSTYAPSIAGGVKEEYVGKGKLVPFNKGDIGDLKSSQPPLLKEANQYEYVVDFDKIGCGSDSSQTQNDGSGQNDNCDLWVWRKAIDFSKDNVDALITPYGEAANIYYTIEGNKIIFQGDKPAEFSYRLTGKRFDWQNWPTFSKDQTENAGFTIK